MRHAGGAAHHRRGGLRGIRRFRDASQQWEPARVISQREGGTARDADENAVAYSEAAPDRDADHRAQTDGDAKTNSHAVTNGRAIAHPQPDARRNPFAESHSRTGAESDAGTDCCPNGCPNATSKPEHAARQSASARTTTSLR